MLAAVPGGDGGRGDIGELHHIVVAVGVVIVVVDGVLPVAAAEHVGVSALVSCQVVVALAADQGVGTVTVADKRVVSGGAGQALVKQVFSRPSHAVGEL